jgi:hypothetical protein
MDRRSLIVSALALGALGLNTAPARAAEVTAFDAKAFSAAQAAGQGIVVFVHAPW